ncbi:MAG: hypothetical protein U5P10_13655 [Spirochaetia bacterium]|nr:hypothetical protein [Spirochaetia bacterium]
MIGADISTVSKHLSLLKAAGIVRREKQGTHVYYSLTCPCVIDAVAQLKPLIKEKLQHYSHMIEVSNP